MRQHMQDTWLILSRSWQQLIVFEILYRILGLVIIYPIVNRLFYWSIRLTGDTFIVNRDLIGYLSRPTTLLVLVLIIFVFGLYVTFEIVTLSILFHQARYERPITLQVLLLTSIQKVLRVYRRYHIIIVVSAMIFLAIVEGLHIVGVASTIQLPVAIQDDLESMRWFVPVLVVLVVVVFVLFFETMFFELQCTVFEPGIKDNIGQAHQRLNGQRRWVLLEFLLINGSINILLYGLYLLVVLGLGVIVAIVENGSIAFTVLLTTLYSIYLVIGFVATIVLLPVNFAWINAWFYQHRANPHEPFLADIKEVHQHKPLRGRTFRRLVSGLFIVLIGGVILLFSVDGIRANTSIALTSNPKVVSHRGGGFYAPENTLASIEEGIRLGADAIEIDIRFTQDGVPVLFHDERTGRTTDDLINRRVADLTYEQLARFDAGSWFSIDYKEEHVPTLEEALALVDRQVEVYIELKASIDNTADIIVSIIEAANMTDKVKILSFNQTLLAEMKTLNDDIETVFLLRDYTGDAEGLIAIDDIDYYGIHSSIALAYPDYIRTLQRAGKGVYVWTINESEAIDTINRLGVDGIITDEPLLVREIVYGDTTKSLYTELLKNLFTVEE